MQIERTEIKLKSSLGSGRQPCQLHFNSCEVDTLPKNVLNRHLTEPCDTGMRLLCSTVPCGSQVLENGIQATEVIPGRSELIDEDQDYPVMVDAANTPESLSRLLDSVRETRPGRVILVFGCEGERNKSLRPFMGEIAHYKVRPRLTSLPPGPKFEPQRQSRFLTALHRHPARPGQHALHTGPCPPSSCCEGGTLCSSLNELVWNN